MEAARIRKKLLEQQFAVTSSRCQRLNQALEARRRKKQLEETTEEPKQQEDHNNGDNHNNREKFRPSRGHLVAGEHPIIVQYPKQLGSATLAPTLMIERRRQQLIKVLARKHELEQKKRQEMGAAKAAARVKLTATFNNNRKSHNKKEHAASPERAGTSAIPRSFFPSLYQRGEVPCTIIFKSTGKAISWMCPLEALDLEYYLPIFIDGIRCRAEPYQFLSRQGCRDLIEASAGQADRILPCIPSIVKGLKFAMQTHDENALRAALATTTQLVSTVPEVGKALVPYYKFLLPVLNLYLDSYTNCGDSFDYKDRDIGQYVNDFLEGLERTGGDDAYATIKQILPVFDVKPSGGIPIPTTTATPPQSGQQHGIGR